MRSLPACRGWTVTPAASRELGVVVWEKMDSAALVSVGDMQHNLARANRARTSHRRETKRRAVDVAGRELGFPGEVDSGGWGPSGGGGIDGDADWGGRLMLVGSGVEEGRGEFTTEAGTTS